MEKKRSECPISCSLDILGDKWSLLIIRDLMFHHKNTYGEFLKSEEHIATNILASRLLALEENGILLKSEHPDSKSKYLYRLTKKGMDLMPIIVEMYLWADQFLEVPSDMKAFFNDAKKDKVGFMKSALKALKKSL